MRRYDVALTLVRRCFKVAASAAVRIKAVIMLLSIQCLLLLLPLGVFFCVGSSFCAVVLDVFSSLAIILLRERERERAGCFTLSALWLSVFCVLCLFLTVPWVGQRSVIVTCPGHTHLFFSKKSIRSAC